MSDLHLLSFRVDTWNKLICVDPETNTNKFWNIKLAHDGYQSYTTQWGRRGTEGVTKTTKFKSYEKAYSAAVSLFNSKVKDGYVRDKPTLELSMETVYTVDHGALEHFIEDVYHRAFDFVADQEARNDTSHRFNVTGKIDPYGREKINDWRDSGGSDWMAIHLLNDCAKKNLIPVGTYIVEVCW